MDFDSHLQRLFRDWYSAAAPVTAPNASTTRLLRLPARDLDFADLQFAMEGCFEQFAYFLPSAILYVEGRSRAWPLVANSLLIGIAGWQERLTIHNVLAPTLERIRAAFRIITSSYEVNVQLANSETINHCVDHGYDRQCSVIVQCVVDGPERAQLVNSLFQHQVPYKESSLFDSIIVDWMSPSDCWERSAHLLDLIVHVDWDIFRKDVYSSEVLVRLRRDRETCRRHFVAASPHIQELCPAAYYEYVASIIAT